jgi:hypothetical protein
LVKFTWFSFQFIFNTQYFVIFEDIIIIDWIT